VAACSLGCAGGATLKGGAGKRSGKPSADRKAETTNADGTSTASDEGDATEEDLRVIPPEIITGAYLTCTTKGTGTTAPDGKVHYGCQARDKETDVPLVLEGFREEWKLRDLFGALVPAIDVAIPEGVALNRIWEIAKKDTKNGLSASLALDGAEATHADVKGKGSVFIDGDLVE
jgi:hypothetical protein